MLNDWKISSLNGNTPTLTRSDATSNVKITSFTNWIRRRNPRVPILVEQSKTKTTSAEQHVPNKGKKLIKTHLKVVIQPTFY